jgi:hypothetical protein
MSLAERAAEVDKYGVETAARYRISNQQYLEALDMIAARKSARTLFVGDVSPAKATLPSLARTISDVGALRELIDNAIDSAQRKELRTLVTVSIQFNATDGTVIVRDNAGGMNKEDMLRCLRLGSVQKEAEAINQIGRFGVGAKEAIYHFGREVIIRSRELDAPEGLRVEVPAAWLDLQDWNVEIQAIEDVQPGSTEIRIGALLKFDFASEQIRGELWTTYRKRIESGRLSIVLGETEVTGAADPELLFLPELYPRSYVFQVLGVMVDLSVCVLRDAPDASGVFFYAFGRQFAHWFWNDPRAKMILEKPPQHKLNTHFRIDLDFAGKIDDLPINANKDEVEPNKVFGAVAKMVQKLCQPYLSSVSWLSQEGKMRYVDRFAGPENAHVLAKVDAPTVDLGKVYDAIQIPKKIRADIDEFKRVLDAEILTSRPPIPEPRPEPPANGDTKDAAGPEFKPGHETSYELPTDGKRSERAEIIATVRLQLHSADVDLLIKLREKLRLVGQALNVRLDFIE